MLQISRTEGKTKMWAKEGSGMEVIEWLMTSDKKVVKEVNMWHGRRVLVGRVVKKRLDRGSG